MNKDEKLSFYIYVVAAMEGMIYPEVVMISANIKNNILYFRFFVDKKPTDFDNEVMANITTDIITNYNIDDVDEKCVQFNKDKFDVIRMMLKYIVFYQRMEKDQYSIYE